MIRNQIDNIIINKQQTKSPDYIQKKRAKKIITKKIHKTNKMDQLPLKNFFNQFGLPQTIAKPQEEEEDAQCCDTKVWLWDGDQYEEFQSDYLNQIFPFKISKKTMVPGAKFIFHFLASSMHYWVELVEGEVEKQEQKSQQQKTEENQNQITTQTPQQQKLGLKDSKFLKNLFATDQSDNWIAFRRWGQQFMQKQHFHKEQQHQLTYQPPHGGQLIHTYTRNNQQFIIMRYHGDNSQFIEFKKRFEVMLLFYIDGVSFVQQQVPMWVYYVVFKRLVGQQKNINRHLFVGVLSLYQFKLSIMKQRHRISQVFILPNYQKYGHGKELIDLVYRNSLQNKNCFQITTQIPSFEYQCLRDYKQVEMLIESKLVNLSEIKVARNQKEINQVRDKILTKDTLREIKTRLKLPGHQIERIVHILIYERILSAKDDMALAHFEQYLRQKIIFNRSPFKSRSKLPHITFYGESPEMKQFYLQKAKEDFLRNQQEIQQILTESINGYKRVVDKLKRANKLL